MAKSIVYHIQDINPENLVRIYNKLNEERPLKGKIAVKISTGEMGGNNYLHPELIGDLVDSIQGTIVECCTAYGGSRESKKKHWKTIEAHGFKPRFPVVIMDEEDEMEIPVQNGFHLDKDIVGKKLDDFDSVLILSHFKGHMMGGFGGALKNISIGIASTAGKAYIHSSGRTTNSKLCWVAGKIASQDDFLESMADACEAVIHHVGEENMFYINVANRLSVDCDCDSHPAEPEMGDLGIFASLDPVALDQACYDAVKNADDPGKAALIERMDSRHGIHTVEAAFSHKLGSREYEIVEL